jgi:hypothetical protein
LPQRIGAEDHTRGELEIKWREGVQAS